MPQRFDASESRILTTENTSFCRPLAYCMRDGKPDGLEAELYHRLTRQSFGIVNTALFKESVACVAIGSKVSNKHETRRNKPYHEYCDASWFQRLVKHFGFETLRHGFRDLGNKVWSGCSSWQCEKKKSELAFFCFMLFTVLLQE